MNVRTRNVILAAVVAMSVPAGTVAVASSAGAATCSTTHTDKYSYTSTGSSSHTIASKRTCGHTFTSKSYRLFRSYTGAHSVTWIYKTGTTSPSHYQEHLIRDSYSKTGRLTVTNEYITR